MRINSYRKLEFQALLDQLMQLEGQLNELDARIEEREADYLAGNGEIAKRTREINPKDRRFSLTSVFSKPSLELLNLDARKPLPIDRARVPKKKKQRKGKSKQKQLSKGRKIKRCKK